MKSERFDPDNTQQYQVFGIKFVKFDDLILASNWDLISTDFVIMSNNVFPNMPKFIIQYNYYNSLHFNSKIKYK